MLGEVLKSLCGHGIALLGPQPGSATSARLCCGWVAVCTTERESHREGVPLLVIRRELLLSHPCQIQPGGSRVRREVKGCPFSQILQKPAAEPSCHFSTPKGAGIVRWALAPSLYTKVHCMQTPLSLTSHQACKGTLVILQPSQRNSLVNILLVRTHCAHFKELAKDSNFFQAHFFKGLEYIPQQGIRTFRATNA